ncbi:MAG TPA: prepilin-type N-terminal cleavage/methylation domain-containing protein [Firmicutes bacterium]|nr:prepilin-type N-terminal cleavage/methylation domain-containing protein [Bacillota bacterium]
MARRGALGVGGFTLVEVVVVLGILVVLTAVSLPVLARHNHTRVLDAAARQLASEFRELQQMARTRRVSCQVTFDETRDTYTVSIGGTQVKGSVEIPGGVRLEADFAGDDPAVAVFDAMGRANGGVVTLTSPGGTRRVHVERAATIYIEK